MACAICETRRPKRYCPGVRGDICTLCCGKEREESVDCPLDCEYLREAHLHERSRESRNAQAMHSDIRVNEAFLKQNEALLVLFSQATLQGVLQSSGAVDTDVGEALEGLIRTYRTLQSGLVYETRPENPIAAGIFRTIQTFVEEIRHAEARSGTTRRLRDADILGILVFLRRMEAINNNGRRRSRAFIGFLSQVTSQAEAPVERPTSSLILP